MTETLLEAEKHSQSEDHARWELQPQLECALQELHRRMQQQLQQDSRTPPHGSSSQEGGHQDQRLSASRAWDVSKRVLWVVVSETNCHACAPHVTSLFMHTSRLLPENCTDVSAV